MSTMDAASSLFSMDSDFVAIGIFAFAFAVAGIVVYIVSVFGAKEQVKRWGQCLLIVYICICYSDIGFNLQ